MEGLSYDFFKKKTYVTNVEIISCCVILAY